MAKKKELIRWVDSKSTTECWTHLDDVDHKPALIETVGWIIFEDKDVLSVAGSISERTDQCTQGIVIPKPCIKSRRVLR